MNLNVIGVSGYANSGKDTVADYLVQEHGFVKISLADPLKRFGYKVFQFNTNQLWGPSAARDAKDNRFDQEGHWDEAEANLKKHGEQFVTDVLGTDDAEAVSAGYGQLVHWFFSLRETHFGKLSPRIMLQTLGTEWGRECLSNDIWIDCLLRTVSKLLHCDGNTFRWRYDPLEGCSDVTATNKFLRQEGRQVPGVVVSDVRFENEFKRIREVGGAVVRVVRPSTDGAATTLGVENHASETHNYSFDDFNLILNNDKTLTHLYDSVDTYMRVFYARHH